MKADWLRGLKASICVDKKALKEYDPDPEEATPALEAVRYVEAVPGAEFAIIVEVASDYQYKHEDIDVSYSLDGKSASKRAFPGGTRNEHVLLGQKHRKNGEWFLTRFAFATLRTSEDAAPEHLDKLGEVQIIFRRAKKISCKASNKGWRQLSSLAEVSEKSLKGRSISTVVGPGRTTKQPRSYVRHKVFVSHPHGDDPIATFTFRYRTHRDLQNEGIIARTPSPPPEVPLEERDPDTLTLEEARELIRRQRAARSTDVEVKREKREHSVLSPGDDDDEVILVGGGPRQAKRPRSRQWASGIEVIELVDD